ncbi:MAG: hypothetical protein R3F54_06920 [Alphaproteobacteria bacterium]
MRHPFTPNGTRRPKLSKDGAAAALLLPTEPESDLDRQIERLKDSIRPGPLMCLQQHDPPGHLCLVT